ncbi:hypothetical protein EG329_003198 [Mollisiaceae sp. DMI_Dod_QoI]|nr:hypothetical protein EG329_003198 [Helotiales sp. DMI_Dod_QoI]
MLFSKLIISSLMAAGLAFAAPSIDGVDVVVRDEQAPTNSFSFAAPTGSRTRGTRPTGAGPRPTGTRHSRPTGTGGARPSRTRRPRPTGSYTPAFPESTDTPITEEGDPTEVEASDS